MAVVNRKSIGIQARDDTILAIGAGVKIDDPLYSFVKRVRDIAAQALDSRDHRRVLVDAMAAIAAFDPSFGTAVRKALPRRTVRGAQGRAEWERREIAELVRAFGTIFRAAGHRNYAALAREEIGKCKRLSPERVQEIVAQVRGE